jgi:hypothetical protein
MSGRPTQRTKPLNVRISDWRLAEWLRSNPAGPMHDSSYQVVGLLCQGRGFLRWPIVNDGQGSGE